MRRWLAKVRPPKYLRYLFFISYSWYRRYKKERLFAEDNAIIFLGAMNGLMYTGLYLFTIQPSDETFSVIAIIVFVFLQQYIWFFYKKKWRSYVDEFKHIKLKEQKKGLWYLLMYPIVCVVIGFYPIIVYLIFDIRL